MKEETVHFQPTPNPNAGKFVVGAAVVGSGGARSFFTREQAEGHPVAAALMALEGVESVFLVQDFITVTKAAEVEWEELASRVEAAIREYR